MAEAERHVQHEPWHEPEESHMSQGVGCGVVVAGVKWQVSSVGRAPCHVACRQIVPGHREGRHRHRQHAAGTLFSCPSVTA